MIEDLRRNLGYAVSTPPRWMGLLRRNLFARNVRGSNTIEGYTVSIDDGIAAVDAEEPFDAKSETWAAVVGYRQAMTYVLQLVKRPHFAYSTETIRALHYMMVQQDLSKLPGNWRPGPIAVFDERKNELAYEGPDADLVPSLMEELAQHLNADTEEPTLASAAMAHLNLIMVHPFKDGNGRMARCLQTLVLARALTQIDPNFVSIEEYLGRNTQQYYDVLLDVGKGRWNPERDAKPWIRFCLRAHYIQATTIKRRLRVIQRVWEALEIEIKNRELPERAIPALAEAAWGLRIRNAGYRRAADVSSQVASRDLTSLVKVGLLQMKGGGRGAYYVASDVLRAIYSRCAEPKRVEDPFEILKARGSPLPLEGNVLSTA